MVPVSIGPWLPELFEIFTRLSSYRAHGQGMILVCQTYQMSCPKRDEKVVKWLACLSLIYNICFSENLWYTCMVLEIVQFIFPVLCWGGMVAA